MKAEVMAQVQWPGIPIIIMAKSHFSLCVTGSGERLLLGCGCILKEALQSGLYCNKAGVFSLDQFV